MISLSSAASDTTSSPVSIPTENEYSGHSVNRDILATTVPTTVSPMHVHFDCIKNGGFAIDCKVDYPLNAIPSQ